MSYDSTLSLSLDLPVVSMYTIRMLSTVANDSRHTAIGSSCRNADGCCGAPGFFFSAVDDVATPEAPPTVQCEAIVLGRARLLEMMHNVGTGGADGEDEAAADESERVVS